MKTNINLDWHKCSKDIKNFFITSAKQVMKKNFSISGNYEREFIKCKTCDHIISQANLR